MNNYVFNFQRVIRTVLKFLPHSWEKSTASGGYFVSNIMVWAPNSDESLVNSLSAARGSLRSVKQSLHASSFFSSSPAPHPERLGTSSMMGGYSMFYIRVAQRVVIRIDGILDLACTISDFTPDVRITMNKERVCYDNAEYRIRINVVKPNVGYVVIRKAKKVTVVWASRFVRIYRDFY